MSSSNSNLCTNGNSSNISKPAINLIREFHHHVEKYKNSKSDEFLVLLGRTASMIKTSIQPQFLIPNCSEIVKFYNDLHIAINTINPKSDPLWTCIALLQHCSSNLRSRQAIIEDFNFIPLLTFVFQNTKEQDNELRLLSILQDLTYGIEIKWEEAYLNTLIGLLVDITFKKDENRGKLAISILVNLCYKNFKVLFLFIRLVDITSFSQRINFYGVHATKLLIILSEVVDLPEIKGVDVFLHSTVNDVETCLKTWNAPLLRDIVDFLIDSKSYPRLHSIVREYDNFCDDIGRYLEIIDIKKEVDNSINDSQFAIEQCLSKLFQLIHYILEQSECPNNDGTESRISLDANMPRIYKLASAWIESEVAGVEATKLLEIVLRLAKKEHSNIQIDSTFVEKLVHITEKTENISHTTAILKLFLTLLSKPKIEKLVLSKISESYFDKMFAPLLAKEMETLLSSSFAFTTEDIEKFILCLLLLINFAEIAKKAYYKKSCSLLQLGQLQVIMAYAMVSGSETACEGVFKLSQFDCFPKSEVAAFVSQINQSNVVSSKSQNHLLDSSKFVRYNQTFDNRECEERINALIQLISEADRNNQLNNIAISQLIELYNYKIRIQCMSEYNMNQRLEEARNEILSLTHLKNMQATELDTYNTTNIKLNISKEKLEGQCRDLNLQRDCLKTNISNLLKKITEHNESLEVRNKQLDTMNTDLTDLQKNYATLTEELKSKNSETERLQSASQENATRVDKLKKTITAYESDIKEKARILEEKERDIARITKYLDDLKDAKKKSEDVIAFLDAEILEKDEKIRNYETELNETEEMQQKILSLMESKRTKRGK